MQVPGPPRLAGCSVTTIGQPNGPFVQTIVRNVLPHAPTLCQHERPFDSSSLFWIAEEWPPNTAQLFWSIQFAVKFRAAEHAFEEQVRRIRRLPKGTLGSSMRPGQCCSHLMH